MDWILASMSKPIEPPTWQGDFLTSELHEQVFGCDGPSYSALLKYNDMAPPNDRGAIIPQSLPSSAPSPSELQSPRYTSSSARDSGYEGSEATTSTSKPLKGPQERPWLCQFCDKSYIHEGHLHLHERKKHEISSAAAKPRQKDSNCSLAEAQDDTTTKSMQSNLSQVLCRETSPVQIDKDNLGGTPITVYLLHKLESSLLELGSQSTERFRIPLVLKIDGTTTNINIDMYHTQKSESHAFVANNATTQLQRFLGDATKSDPWTLLRHSPFENIAHPSTGEEAKLMKYQKHDTTTELDSAKGRDNLVDDTSYYSGAFIDSSEQEEDDSDYESDDITSRDCYQQNTLPSFLPYIQFHDADASSPCGDSPDSGYTTSGMTSGTPTSYVSSFTGGSHLQANGSITPGSGTGLPNNNSNDSILEIKDKIGAKVNPKPQPLPLICWYSAAGIACTAKYVKRSTEVRYLWNDHAWGKNERSPNHRLSDACQRCKRLFLTKEHLDAHVEEIEAQGPCPKLSSSELEEFNWEPNRLGISRECKEAVEKLRARVDKELKENALPALHDHDTMALLKQRVDSNVLLYINGSNTSEKTARSELWKWYLIFKQLRPEDEVPRNPFISALQPATPQANARAEAVRIFMQILDQSRMAGYLPGFDDNQRTTLGRVFLDTLEMLGANEANQRSQSIQSTNTNPRKRQRRSPPENYVPASDSVDLTLAPTVQTLAPTPTPTPTPTPVPAPSPVPNPLNDQRPTFALPDLRDETLLQTSPFCWELQQQQEAEDAWSLFPADDLSNTCLSTDQERRLEF